MQECACHHQQKYLGTPSMTAGSKVDSQKWGYQRKYKLQGNIAQWCSY